MNEELLNVCRLNQYDLNLHGLSTVGGIGSGPVPDGPVYLFDDGSEILFDSEEQIAY